MSRKTADNITSVQPNVSRVKIFNASSERYEAPKGRHTVQIPSNVTETNQVRFLTGSTFFIFSAVGINILLVHVKILEEPKKVLHGKVMKREIQSEVRTA